MSDENYRAPFSPSCTISAIEPIAAICFREDWLENDSLLTSLNIVSVQEYQLEIRAILGMYLQIMEKDLSLRRPD